MFVCVSVHDLSYLLEILSEAGVDLIYPYIIGDMSVLRTRRSAHVFVRTISVAWANRREVGRERMRVVLYAWREVRRQRDG
jgi:hypothetical protein